MTSPVTPLSASPKCPKSPVTPPWPNANPTPYPNTIPTSNPPSSTSKASKTTRAPPTDKCSSNRSGSRTYNYPNSNINNNKTCRHRKQEKLCPIVISGCNSREGATLRLGRLSKRIGSRILSSRLKRLLRRWGISTIFWIRSNANLRKISRRPFWGIRAGWKSLIGTTPRNRDWTQH